MQERQGFNDLYEGQAYNGDELPLSYSAWYYYFLLLLNKVETKYCDESSARKYERMLLFDRIISAILYLFFDVDNKLYCLLLIDNS